GRRAPPAGWTRARSGRGARRHRRRRGGRGRVVAVVGRGGRGARVPARGAPPADAVRGRARRTHRSRRRSGLRRRATGAQRLRAGARVAEFLRPGERRRVVGRPAHRRRRAARGAATPRRPKRRTRRRCHADRGGPRLSRLRTLTIAVAPVAFVLATMPGGGASTAPTRVVKIGVLAPLDAGLVE